MCRVFGDTKLAAEIERLGERVLKATVARFWSREHGAFVDNLPWWREDGGVHFSEMTLGISVEYDQFPGGAIKRSKAQPCAHANDCRTVRATLRSHAQRVADGQRVPVHGSSPWVLQ
jgi:hypothetical protein